MNVVNVSDVNKYIKKLFEQDANLTSILVRGEISNFKRHYSGHLYFTLKDSSATIKAVMFKSRAQFVRFNLADGLKVIAGGNISVFERDGQYQLYVEQLFPDGIGELSLAFAQLKEKLGAEGLFADERKKALPRLPRKIGIVTSPTGAVIKDIFTVAKRRFPGIALVLYPVQVQGPEAPKQIVHAIKVFNTLADVDVLIVGRGGGSIEELWAFNDEAVVRAIADSKIPIVSAVGHQTDFTLADFAADKRAATPSHAAEIVVPDVKELSKYIMKLSNILENNTRNIIKDYRIRTEKCMNNKVLKYPMDSLNNKRQLLDRHIGQLSQVMKKTIMDKQYKFKVSAEKLSMLNPISVLARGYSIVNTPNGNVITSTKNVKQGDLLAIKLNNGSLSVEVQEVKEEQNGKS